MERSNKGAVGTTHAWILHTLLIITFLISEFDIAKARAWMNSGRSPNERETRSLHDIADHNSSEPRSLAFIFDVTGSMEDDWKGAISGGKMILNEFLSYEKRPVSNFILVPFRDPEVGPTTNTENSNIFLEELNKLKIYGGGDCPEVSVSAIKEALDTAYPYSYLYVFTDASSKDYYRLEEVLTLIQRKHSQVVFFITGDCGQSHDEAFLVYERIASASYGQMYYLLKKNVNDVLKSVLITTKPNKSNLLVVSSPELDPHNSVHYNLSVESDLKELIVEVAGASPEVDIKNPLGNPPDKINIPFDLPNNKFIVIEYPKPAGNWVLKVTFHPEVKQKYPVDNPIITVKAFGSAFEIKHGFSVMPANNLSGTAYRPMEKTENYIYMEVHPTEDNLENKEKVAKFEWKSVDIMKNNGKPYMTLPLKYKPPSIGEEILPMRYLAGPFTPPDDLFNLAFQGFDENKKPVRRLTSNFISAEEASAPYVKMTASNEFVVGKELRITCEVESLIEFSLQWYREGKAFGIKKDFPQSSEDSLTIPIAKKEDGGQYKCEATNIRGSDSKTVAVTGIALPEINGMEDVKVAVVEGASVIINCEVKSDLVHDVKWIHKKDGIEEDISLAGSSDFKILENNSLSISILKSSIAGKYVCRASNKAGITEKEVEINMISLPKVEISTEDILMLTEGESVKIDCNVATNAKTKVHWEFNGAIVGRSKEIYTNDTIPFNIVSADQTWEGKYVCVAENEAGKVQKQVEGIYVVLPSAKALTPYVAIKLGEDAALSCLVTGIPPPVISWALEDKPLTNGPKYQISSDGSSLKILKSNLADEGTYKCLANGPKNSESVAEIKLRIGKPPVAKHLFLNGSLELKHDGEFPCETEYDAENTLFPGMKAEISWKRQTGALDPKRHEILKSGNLKVKDAEITDQGSYVCTLRNDFGETDVMLNLEIKGINAPHVKITSPNEFLVGNDMVLTCEVESLVPFSLQWYKDGKAFGEIMNFPESSTNVVTLRKAKKEDEGQYKCEAANFIGSDTNTMAVAVIAPPIINGMDDVQVAVAEGSSVTLNCDVVSDSLFDVKWIHKKSGIEEDISLSASSDINILENNSLSISFLKSSDAGMYLCRASNKAGITEKEVEIIMISPPKVEISLKDIFMFTKGERVYIDCIVASNAKTIVHWEFNGAEVGKRKEIHTNDSIPFIVTSADKSWEGTYVCVAENEAGKVKKQVESIYVVLPSAKALSPYVAVKPGEDATLECLVTGIPPPVISWTLEDKPLTNGPKYQISSDGSSLKIFKSNLVDEGTYKCVAHGPKNSKSVAEIKLRIGKPPVAKQLYLYSSMEPKDDGEFPCEAEYDADNALFPGMKAVVSWKRQTGALNSARHKILRSGALRINDAEYADQGVYICTLRNHFGQTHVKLNLEMKGIIPPKLEASYPEDIHFKRGETIVLWCNATGTPLPRITWSYQADESSEPEILEDGLDEKDTILVKGGKLILYDVVGAYEGIYSCVAENDIGQSSSSKTYNLQIIERVPVLIEDGKPTEVTLHKGDSYTMSCSSSSPEKLSYSWLKDEIYVIKSQNYFTFNADKSKLTLRRVTPRLHNGTYRCKASNGVGYATRLFTISVENRRARRFF